MKIVLKNNPPLKTDATVLFASFWLLGIAEILRRCLRIAQHWHRSGLGESFGASFCCDYAGISN